MKKSEISAIKVGTRLSRIQYYEVIPTTAFNESEVITIKSQDDLTFHISTNIVEAEMYTPDQFSETVEMTRTELCEKFVTCYGGIFTANFNKQPKMKEVTDALKTPDETSLTHKEIVKRVRTAFKGEDRTLVGYLIEGKHDFGRSMCIDLEKEKGSNPEWDGRIVQLDHRTLNWFIYQNTKFVIKGKSKATVKK